MTFKIALPGFNVHTSHLQEEVVDDLYPSPKINTKANPPHAGVMALNWNSTGISVPFAATKLLYSFSHNYSYIPTAVGTHSFDNGSIKINGVLPFQLGGLGLIILDTDSKNVNLKYVSTDLSNTFPIPPFIMRIHFYVFAERGHE